MSQTGKEDCTFTLIIMRAEQFVCKPTRALCVCVYVFTLGRDSGLSVCWVKKSSIIELHPQTTPTLKNEEIYGSHASHYHKHHYRNRRAGEWSLIPTPKPRIPAVWLETPFNICIQTNTQAHENERLLGNFSWRPQEGSICDSGGTEHFQLR